MAWKKKCGSSDLHSPVASPGQLTKRREGLCFPFIKRLPLNVGLVLINKCGIFHPETPDLRLNNGA